MPGSSVTTQRASAVVMAALLLPVQHATPKPRMKPVYNIYAQRGQCKPQTAPSKYGRMKIINISVHDVLLIKEIFNLGWVSKRHNENWWW